MLQNIAILNTVLLIFLFIKESWGKNIYGYHVFHNCFQHW